MRMWNVDPTKMCRQHLLGEHNECHMFVGTINRGISVQGYLDNLLLDPSTLRSRHDELSTEMIRRGYKHNSPLPEFNKGELAGIVLTKDNEIELRRRCKNCKL